MKKHYWTLLGHFLGTNSYITAVAQIKHPLPSLWQQVEAELASNILHPWLAYYSVTLPYSSKQQSSKS